MKERVSPMRLKLTAVALALSMLTGCNGAINAGTYKAYIQVAASTFIATEQALNPQWHSQKLAADVNGLIAVWNTGAGWQANAINELMLIQGDVGDIPNCTNECAALVLVFTGAIATGIAIAQANQPSGAAKVTMNASRPHGKVYATRDEYKADWNKVAPEGHRL